MHHLRGLLVTVLGRLLQLLTDGVGGPNGGDTLVFGQIGLGRKVLDVRIRGGDLVLPGFIDNFIGRVARRSVGRLKDLLEGRADLVSREWIGDLGGVPAATEDEQQ
jgi:hypothetical protein